MKRKQRLCLAAGIAAGTAALTGMFCYITKKMLAVAIARQMPRPLPADPAALIRIRQLQQLLQLQALLADTLESLPMETLTLTARDGTKLTGHLFRHKNAKRTIVAMHGWRSGWAKDFGMLADFFFENQCNVLFAEQRAQGSSEGSYITFGLQERFDCLDWVHFLNSLGFESLPMYLMGFSMGATTVLMCSGFSLPANVKGIIADCGFTSPADIWKHVARKKMHLSYGPVQRRLVGALCRSALQAAPDDYSCAQALQNCRVSVLFVHGADDHFVPVEMTYENYKACAAPKQLLIIPGADHGMSHPTEPEKYRQTLLQFFRAQEAG